MKATNQRSGARVLIVKMSSLGDLFHALPTVHSLKTGLNAAIDWVANSEYAETLACCGDLDKVIEFPRREILAGHARFVADLREREYDLVCDLQGLLKSAYVALLARGERRIGPSFCREGVQHLYRETAGEKNKERHAVEECLDLVRYLGLDYDQSPPPLAFPEYSLDLPAPLVVFAPVSRWATKNWPIEHFVHLGRHLQLELGASICVVGGPDDLSHCERIATGIGPDTVNLAGQTSIPELGSVLKQADLLVSVDSGPVHIAAALGTPVLGLYGITDPLRTGPYGDIHRVLRASAPAGRHGDFRKSTLENLAVMSSIAPETVAAAARAMLAC